MTDAPRTVAVVGAGLAGLSAARALRAQGFTGQLTIVGAEPHRPYDRPPLSKEFLAGRCTEDALALTEPGEDLDARWLLGRQAVGLDAGERAVLLDDGRAVRAHGVVIASGAAARTLPGAPAGVHTLRTLEDAWALRADLVLARRVVVIGAGFIGLEVAATLTTLGLPVTVLEAGPAPLSTVLGSRLGAVLGRAHTDRGVDLRCGVGVAGFECAEDGRVSGVRLADGSAVAADVVVVGVGARPAVDWLVGSGVLPAGADPGAGIPCDAAGATAVAGVVAVGDCAAWYEPRLRRPHRVEHWTGALERPAVAVATLLGTVPPRQRLPYFWSDQYDARIQFAGHAGPADEVAVEDGDPTGDPTRDGAGFLAVYRRGGEPVGVLGVDRPRLFNQWRRRLDSAPVPVPPA
jgi:NADPH-dependent 2,4-dienoyl-CoA reductase/sulfur reductase-like enzyme